MPPDTDPTSFVVPRHFFGPEWGDYEVRFTGLHCEDPTQRRGPRFDLLPAPDARGPLFLEVWSARVFRPSSPVYGDRRWHPDLGTWEELSSENGTLRDATDKELRDARNGLKLLHKQRILGAGGRPAGTRKGRVWTRREYLDWYHEAGQDYALGTNRRVSLKELGDAMGVSGDTASARLKAPDVDLPWPPEAHLDIWDPDD